MTDHQKQRELKKPDAFQALGKKLLAKIKSHQGTFVGAALVLLLSVLGFVGFSIQQEKKEELAQENFIKIERQIEKKQSDFEQAKQELRQLEAENAKAKKGEQKIVSEELKNRQPSQDLQKDFGPEIADLKSFIQTEKGKKAALMAGLRLHKLYVDYKATDQSLELLQGLAQENKHQDFISGLVRISLAKVLMKEKKYTESLKEWDVVLAHRALSFYKEEARLQRAICLKETGQLGEAEKELRLIASSGQVQAKTAEKILLLLKAQTAVNKAG